MEIILNKYAPNKEGSQPTPKQKEFHASKAKNRCYQGGVGAGKTLAGCWEALFLSLEYPKNTGLIARQTFPALRDTTMATFFEICPKNLIHIYNQTEHNLVLVNGSRILFRSFETLTSIQKRNKFGSLELGWFYFDEGEEVSRDSFLLLQGRLRKPNIPRLAGFITTNPPNIDHWIYEFFVEKQNPDYHLIKASTYENRENLPEGYIENLESIYDENWINKYLKGEFGFLGEGLPVYPKFSSAFVREKLNFSFSTPIYRGWDFGFRHPAVVFCQKTPQNFIILAELMEKDQHIYEFGKLVAEKSREWFGKDVKFVDFAPLDGTFKSDKSELSSIQYLNQLGIRPRVVPITSITKKATAILRQLMASCQLVVDVKCRKLIEGFSGGYTRDTDDETPKKDGFYDHLQDALNCVVWSIFSVSETIQPFKKEPAPPYRARGQEIIYDFEKEIKKLEEARKNQTDENLIWRYTIDL